MKDVYGLPTVVAVNRFPTDTDAEVQLVIEECAALGVKAILSDVWAKGGEGAGSLPRRSCACATGNPILNSAMTFPAALKINSQPSPAGFTAAQGSA